MSQSDAIIAVLTDHRGAEESAVLVGGLSALGAALYSVGIPKDSVLDYETAVKADGCLVVAHGTAEEMARAKTILDTSNPRVLTYTKACPKRRLPVIPPMRLYDTVRVSSFRKNLADRLGRTISMLMFNKRRPTLGGWAISVRDD